MNWISNWVLNWILPGMLLGIAVLYDYRERRIPNLLVFFGGGIGLLFLSARGSEGVVSWAAGALPCLLFLFLLWTLHMIGGGDVKLFTMVSFYLGKGTAVFVFASAAAVAAYGLTVMLIQGSLFRRFQVFFDYVRECVAKGKLFPYPFSTEKEKKEGGVPVSYGAFAAYLMFLVFELIRN